MANDALQGLSPFAAELREKSPDRYLATLFAPSARRADLIALYMFDHEITRIRHLVQEPMAGMIRLQWWRDALAATARGEIVDHPVLRELSGTFSRGLDANLLQHAIDGRSAQFEGEGAGDAIELERQALAAEGPIIRAAATLSGIADPAMLDLAEGSGRVIAALEQRRFLEGRTTGEGAPGSALADRSLAWLNQARRDHPRPPRALLPMLFPATLAALRLRRPDAAMVEQALPSAPFRLLWHWLRRRF